MPQVGFEPIIPAFERAKTVHATDRAANVIGQPPNWRLLLLVVGLFSEVNYITRDIRVTVKDELPRV
jgi:hypothetical protein